ncbi:pyrroline-5-carboxylate reductase family protein [Tropheryma whipplei]|uniref:Pyrroline-5-carboxylate reductase n=1 Tax=Tropheryma whipplei (strain Twist) TaxID=203267 RepID=Q83FH8_TROWT|nr:pyrroline-5-carboxylate reductase dimerization domain-containing protein [Tropheryma whipplei]AAO44849.1 pyrroline-5-carboxylate reductase [Tropheryma whipplei str. Twist]MCO8190281.1 NAD(P)-binding domain-containing protein [Tropheryma whipplei]CAD67423.1 pyrroline-5-carboxylate reductase [Tropheryma whipplei TW08/27]
MLRSLPQSKPLDDLIGRTIAVIGLGTMGAAIAEGIARARKAMNEEIPRGQFYCTKREYKFERNSVITSESVVLYIQDDPDANITVTQRSDLIIIAVRPEHIKHVLNSISPALDRKKLIVSLAKDVNLSNLAAMLPSGTAIVRCATNLPITVRHGFTGLSCNKHVLPSDVKAVYTLFELLGRCTMLSEEHLTIVSAITGFYPVYMLYMLTKIKEATEKLGLPRDISQAAVETAWIGYAQVVLKHKTTAKGLLRLIPRGPRSAVVKCLDRTDLGSVTYKVLLASIEQDSELLDGIIDQ